MKQYFRMYKKHPKAVALRILVTAAAALTVLMLFSLVFYILIKGIPNLSPRCLSGSTPPRIPR